jgi:hypothetical protein
VPFIKRNEVNFFFFLIFLMLFQASDFSFLLMDPFRHLIGLLGRGISPAPRPLPTHRTTQHRETHTSMLRAGSEPAIPMFERQKTVLALDRAAIETGVMKLTKEQK